MKKEQNIDGLVVIYVKMERSIEVEEPEVFLKDIASIECQDGQVKERAEKLCIHRFKVEGQKRAVISVLRVIQLLEQELKLPSKSFGGMEVEDERILVLSVGEKDAVVQWVKQKEQKSPAKPWRIALVSLVTFCGTAFTIVAYHNDIEIHKIFEGAVKLILLQNLDLGLLILEVTYSIGLAVGIIVFFNHVGKWKLSNDPTPMEVALRKYEMDVDTTLIENADREGQEVESK